jgi:hypothetical protein
MTKHKGTHPGVSLSPARTPANPALWGYGFGGFLIGLGLLVLSIALGSALRSATRGIHRLTLPGRSVLELKEGLHVAILPAAKTGLPPEAGGVDVDLVDEAGRQVPRVPFPPEMSQANRRIGTTLFQAQIPYDGRYALEGRLPAGSSPAELLLIHESLSRNPSDILVGAILFLVLGGFGVYIIVLAYRRGRAAPAK